MSAPRRTAGPPRTTRDGGPNHQPRTPSPAGLALWAIAALTVLAYANSFSGGFVLDSLQLVVRDARVHAPTSENLRLIFSHTYWWPL